MEITQRAARPGQRLSLSAIHVNIKDKPGKLTPKVLVNLAISLPGLN
jgi:hypothetical protein